MPVSARRHKGKFKREIADEAFQKLGKTATTKQIDAYFKKHYNLPACERSMYWAARRKAEGKPGPVRRQYRQTNRKDIPGIIARVRELAHDVGGYHQLIEIISSLTDGT